MNPEPEQATGAEAARSYGRGAGLLSVGIGASGALTYLYFALASHSLDGDEYGGIVVLWSALFVCVVTLYRPVEQLLSRTLAERDLLGLGVREPLKVAATIQLALALGFVVVVLLARAPLEDELLGSATLYWIFLLAAPAYAASYFARGFLAGRRRFGLYGGMLLLESGSRLAFALAVAIGVASGQSVVALGILAAPVLSLMVVPLLAVRAPALLDPAGTGRAAPSARPAAGFTGGGAFAAAVFVIILSEQTLLNVGPLIVRGLEGAAAAGLLFNVLMVARAPQVLFQAVTTSLLPNLTRLWTGRSDEHSEAFQLSVRSTLLAVLGFAAAVALTVLVAGPALMRLAFGDSFSYDRLGLVIVATGMGFHLASLTLNQAALARGQARAAALRWAGCACAFVLWALLGPLDAVRRAEVGFLGAAALLCALLYVLYRGPPPRHPDAVLADTSQPVAVQVPAADEAG